MIWLLIVLIAVVLSDIFFLFCALLNMRRIDRRLSAIDGKPFGADVERATITMGDGSTWWVTKRAPKATR